MRKPSVEWWKKVKPIADSYSEEESEGILDDLIKEKMENIAQAIEELLAVL